MRLSFALLWASLTTTTEAFRPQKLLVRHATVRYSSRFDQDPAATASRRATRQQAAAEAARKDALESETMEQWNPQQSSQQAVPGTLPRPSVGGRKLAPGAVARGMARYAYGSAPQAVPVNSPQPFSENVPQEEVESSFTPSSPPPSSPVDRNALETAFRRLTGKEISNPDLDVGSLDPAAVSLLSYYQQVGSEAVVEKEYKKKSDFRNDGPFGWMSLYLYLGGIEDGKKDFSFVPFGKKQESMSEAESALLKEQAAKEFFNISPQERENRATFGMLFTLATGAYLVWSTLNDQGDMAGHLTRLVGIFPAFLAFGYRESAKTGL